MLDKITKGVAFAMTLDKDKINTTLAQTAGFVATFSAAKDLDTLGIADLDKWSKREKNVFAVLLRKNAQMTEIIKQYNHYLADAPKEDIDRIALFQKLNTASKFLKAHPYNMDAFEDKVYKSIINWEITGEKTKSDLLISGLQRYVDKPTLKDMMGTDMNRRKAAINLIEAKNIVGEKSIDKDITLMATASIAAVIITASTANGLANTELAKSVMPYVNQHLGTSPTIGTFALCAVAVVIAYQNFKMFNEFANSVTQSILKNTIRIDRDGMGVSSQKVNKSVSQDYISSSLLKRLTLNRTINVSNEDNHNYIALMTFLNEKAYKPDTKLPSSIIQNMGMKHMEVDRINKLKESDVHEISGLKFERTRMAFLRYVLSDEQKTAFKNMDTLMTLKNKQPIEKPFENKYPDNLLPYLNDQMNKMNPVDKELFQMYLKMHTNSKNHCNSAVMENLKNNISQGIAIKTIVALESEITLREHVSNLKAEKPHNIKDALKSIIGLFTKEESIDIKSKEVLNLLEKNANDFNYENTKKTINYQTPLYISMINKAQTVLNKIHSLRNQATPQLQNNNGNHP